MNRLLIIDGNAILHRAYHAIPPLTAPDGSVINAVYGFTTMLLRLHHDLQPSHIAVAFDRKAPTFRKKMFAGYQIKRPKMEENLISQIPKVHELVESFGIPIFEKDGFEADDVIGTLCRLVTSEKRLGTGKKLKRNQSPVSSLQSPIDQAIVVTGDRDILQLVDGERIMVYMPVKGLSEGKLYQDKDVLERIGVEPKKIPDYKGLAGDSSDNYPGVEGIGPKTAVDLIKKYGSIENLYHKGDKGNWGDVGSRVKEKLIQGKEMAFMSKDLATIRTDVPLDGKLIEIPSLDTPKAREELGKFHFHSLIKRLGSDNSNQIKDSGLNLSTSKTGIKEENKSSQQQELF